MSSDLVEAVVSAVGRVVGPGPVGLHDPVVGTAEGDYIAEALATAQVSSVGPLVSAFEDRLAKECEVGHAVSTVNGTAALHIALRLVGVKPGDCVIMAPLSFVAPANAIAYCGAVPIFVDVDSETWGLDPEALRRWLNTHAAVSNRALVARSSGKRVRAIVAVDVFGHPCRLNDIAAVADEFNLPLIEDAAGALGSRWRGRPCGTYGTIATMSFNGNKTVTAGGGGAILCDDNHIAERAKHLTTTAKVPHAWRYFHDEVGYNYRMPNLNAALALGQLESLSDFVERKRVLYDRYRRELSDVSGVKLKGEVPGARSNFWLQNLVLDDSEVGQRDLLLDALNDHGFGSRPAWELLSDLPAFNSCDRSPIPVAENLVRRVVSIPSGAGLV